MIKTNRLTLVALCGFVIYFQAVKKEISFSCSRQSSGLTKASCISLKCRIVWIKSESRVCLSVCVWVCVSALSTFMDPDIEHVS